MIMPNETQLAINWALQQKYEDNFRSKHYVKIYNQCELVDKVREYFDINNIDCKPFCYDDLKPYLTQ